MIVYWGKFIDCFEVFSGWAYVSKNIRMSWNFTSLPVPFRAISDYIFGDIEKLEKYDFGEFMDCMQAAIFGEQSANIGEQ